MRDARTQGREARFFLDLDNGIRGASLLAFVEDIRSPRDAFYLKISKSLGERRGGA